jgi:PERQ amino acid-rich with GYF domain-containing protein
VVPIPAQVAQWGQLYTSLKNELIIDDEMFQMWISLPPYESNTEEIIRDTIYAHTSTVDGRHFAEEFLKRRKALGAALDITVATPLTATNTGSANNSGSGWNEVAKKEKPKDASGEWNSAFKIVERRGRRR